MSYDEAVQEIVELLTELGIDEEEAKEAAELILVRIDY